jgi:hypothetical protein
VRFVNISIFFGICFLHKLILASTMLYN